MMDAKTYSLDWSTATEHLSTPLFSLKGIKPGPRLVVTGPDPLVRQLAERFWDLTGLGRMRGSLVLRPNTQDPVFDRPDFTLSLRTVPETDAYYQVLGRMAELGMINGRGVPMPRVA